MSILSRATGTSRARNPRDFYPTIDPRAVAPLVAHLGTDIRYAEPCAGGGDLVDLLDAHDWQCQWASDMMPARRLCHSTGQLIGQADVRFLPHLLDAHPELMPEIFVTNPPWKRKWMHKIISTLATIRPTWLLFDAGWKETQQAARFAPWCHTIISVGRLIWIEDSEHQSTDDVSWYGFDARHSGPTQFIWPKTLRAAAAQGSLF